MVLHIVPMDVVYDKGKRVHQSKNEERVRNPPMKYLEPFVRHSCDQCDPIRFARRGTEDSQ